MVLTAFFNLRRSDSVEDSPESVQILLVEQRLQNATQIPEFASYFEIKNIFDEVLRLPRESGLRVALRVLVLMRLKNHEGKFVVFRQHELSRCVQVFENKRSFGKLSAWQLLLSRLVEVFPLPMTSSGLFKLSFLVVHFFKP